MPERILVINRRPLGDTIMSTAAIRLIRRARPQAHITVLAREMMLPLLLDPRIVDDGIFDVDSEGTFLRGIARTWKIFRRRRQFDTCFFFGESAHNAKRYRLLGGIPDRVCADANLNGKPYGPVPYCNHVISAGSFRETHRVEHFQNIVRGYYGIEGSEEQYIAPSAIDADYPFIRELKEIRGRKIALSFEGSRDNLCRWPAESWIRLIRRFHEQGFFLFTASPPAQVSAAKTVVAASGIPVHVVSTTLPQCLGCLSQADLLVTIDTGQSHLAAALGVPVVSLSGSTLTATYPHARRGLALGTARNCFDCRFSDACPSNKKDGITHAPGYIAPCMRHLEVETVYEWAMKILETHDCDLPPYHIVGEQG